MTLDARRVALQGLGYGALVTALQGLVPIEVTDIPVTVVSGGSVMPRQIYVPRSRAYEEDEELMLLISAALHVIDPL